MTPAQFDALGKANQILAEHFDNAVISVAALSDDGAYANHIRIPSGDVFAALGLLEAARHQLLMNGQQVSVGGDD